MSLTLGSMAPFGRPTGGALNVEVPASPAHLLYLHRLPQRIRGVVAGRTVLDTCEARMLHETAMLPRWYLPRDAVPAGLLEASDTVTHCPFKGDARYWDLRVGDRLVADAFWEYPEPAPGAPDLTGLVSPYLEKFDVWLEEDEELVGHPRDPFHRVDILRSSRTVTVTVASSAGGAVLASSGRAVAVNETGLPTRWYLPAADVTAPLRRSDARTVCPYKGVASYWHLDVGGTELADAVWGYEQPLAPAGALAGLVSFQGEGVEVAAVV